VPEPRARLGQSPPGSLAGKRTSTKNNGVSNMGNCKICLVAVCAGAIGFGGALMLGAGEPPKTAAGTKKMDDKHAMPAGGDKMAEMMQKCMAAGMPGEMHKKLDWFSGKWDCEISHIMNGETHVSKGSAVGEMIYDGRYSKMSFEGDMMGEKFTGMSLVGYNNVSKMFESMWVDSMSTAMMTMTGKLNEKGNEYSWTGQYHCPMTEKLTNWREITTIVDENTYRMDFYMPNMETGKEEMQMTITYKRAK
jgi:hypothetical protein